MIRLLGISLLALGLIASPGPGASAQQTGGQQTDAQTYDQNEILTATEDLFGKTTQGLAEVVEKVFGDLGQPTAYIAGEEFSGAFGVGLRYGRGTLNTKTAGATDVFWQGPSIGFDIGGNASKVFVLVYDLAAPQDIFRRLPGVEGTYYFVAGVGVNYQTDGDITVAPIRTGVGLRAGVNIGYLHYSPEFSWLPF